MDPFTITVLAVISLILLSIPAMFVISWHSLRQRQRQFQTYAETHGFSYTAKARVPAELLKLPYFQDGVQLSLWRRMKNILHRTRAGNEMLVFDYWYVRSTVNLPTSRTTRATVVCLRHGASSPWQVFHQDGPQYLDFGMLDWFVDESLKKFRAVRAE